METKAQNDSTHIVRSRYKLLHRNIWCHVSLVLLLNIKDPYCYSDGTKTIQFVWFIGKRGHNVSFFFSCKTMLNLFLGLLLSWWSIKFLRTQTRRNQKNGFQIVSLTQKCSWLHKRSPGNRTNVPGNHMCEIYFNHRRDKVLQQRSNVDCYQTVLINATHVLMWHVCVFFSHTTWQQLPTTTHKICLRCKYCKQQIET